VARIVVGLFDEQEDARQAVQDLTRANFPAEKISIVGTDPEGHFQRYKVDDQGSHAGEGAAAGAAGGAVVGGIFGLLVGVGALAFPAIGLVAVGPIAGMLAGAGIGAVSGGLIGALIGWGVPEEEAHTYAEAVRRGGVLVTVHTDDARTDEAERILEARGAVDVEERAERYRQEGFTRFDPTLPALTKEETQRERERFHTSARAQKIEQARQPVEPPTPRARVRTYLHVPEPMAGEDMVVVDEFGDVAEFEIADVPDMEYVREIDVQPEPAEKLDPIFRRDFEQRFGSGLAFGQFRPAYRFGYNFAFTQEAVGRNFSESETAARLRWERYNPGTWRHYVDVIRHGFEMGSEVRWRSGGASLQ
jgi:hypothetical protein